VYLAEHEVIGREVAIKVLNRAASDDEDAVSRFFLEARTVSRIRHPNIIEVTDFGYEDDLPFIVMEFLEGETLGDRLQKHCPLDAKNAVHICRQVASALAAVHKQGLIHRDLKPDNIFLCSNQVYDDFVKVLDFGIAKLTTQEAESVDHKTRAGTLLGTPLYMSPEQCLGQADIDTRSDLYSLGCLMYLVFTGTLPYGRQNSFGELVLAHTQMTPIQPSRRNPLLPRALDEIISICMAKRRRDRFESMDALIGALDAVFAEPAPGPDTSAVGLPTLDEAGVAIPADPVDDDITGKTAAPLATPEAVNDNGASRVDGFEPDLDQTGAVPVAVAREEGSTGFALNVPTALLQAPASNGDPTTRPLPSPEWPLPTRLEVTLTPIHDALVTTLIRHTVGRIDAGKLFYPRPDGVTRKCLDIIDSPYGSFAILEQELLNDPSLARLAVQHVNQIKAGTAAPARSVRQAIQRAGLPGMRRTLFEIAARKTLLPTSKNSGRFPRRIWSHTLASTLIADRVCRIGRSHDLADHLHTVIILRSVALAVVVSDLLADRDGVLRTPGTQPLTREAMFEISTSVHKKVIPKLINAWRPSPTATNVLEALFNPAQAQGAGAATLILATALANREGFYLRQADLYGVENTICNAKVALNIDDKLETRILHNVRPEIEKLVARRSN